MKSPREFHAKPRRDHVLLVVTTALALHDDVSLNRSAEPDAVVLFFLERNTHNMDVIEVYVLRLRYDSCI